MEYFKVILSLLFIIVALYMVLRVMKSKINPGKGFIQIIYYQPIGYKKGIGVVKAFDEYLLVGISENGINLISKLDSAKIKAIFEEKTEERKTFWHKIFKGGLYCFCLLLTPALSFAAPQPQAGGGFFGFSSAIDILVFITLLSFLPAILIMMTSFTRIVIVLSLLRQALGTPAVPPNQVIIGLALFLTLFIMSPTIDRVYKEAYVPFSKKEINMEEAINRASVPFKEFMLKQTREKDLALFLKLSKTEVKPATPMDLPMKIVVPAFALGELKRAFEIGFLIFLPFLVIDIVVASILLSMGMFMVPPVMISMPFKLLLFVLVDGWQLIIGSLAGGFR
ncbi:MAG: flagellar type III secretion system pore protein FliP [Thermodesulfovibrio sp.]|uniref:flagellar type III secretion system pore protein FliP n=1 Tax=Thermodesulfovibrio sp. N1 TaxID=1871110 RepID=UPI0008559849|nr:MULTISPECIES: flagellar type III secretion system pore protein FliP [unclassified Thermodesulfovibrio]MDI1471812.1 flagellar type III secretion system pore protein FliP [Thermodesulfovibrio sp. 1176]MDI6713702.1 flagellar type III secretion system pore protein FliP [Thermodesulfovibrio sp.]ODA43325.1 Flagellar biosynthesis protein FliP [Thermodesulfovibrio sp. N1]